MASTFDKLPADVLSSHILQLFPAKELCRLRTVCRSWRSLTSDADFIKAHAERHSEPLFLAKFRDDDTSVYVVDLSGNVVKQLAGADGGYQVSRSRTPLNLACLTVEWKRCRLLNPATESVFQVRDVRRLLPATHFADDSCLPEAFTFSLGLVASTGEYKLLCCWRPKTDDGLPVQVLTINGDTGWRTRPGPHRLFDMRRGTVVGGVVYFFLLTAYYEMAYGTKLPADDILSFDLAREEWRRDLHGPLSTCNDFPSPAVLQCHLTLADLKGSLVLAQHRPSLSTLDLWFLLDFESGLWVKEYSIRTESVASSVAKTLPLLVLHDGRLVIYLPPLGLLLICDPGTNTFTRVDMIDHLDSVCVYTGSLLTRQEVVNS